MGEISADARSMVGHEVTYTKGDKTVTATVDGVRRSGSVIEDGETGERFPGIQFLIAGRWTTAFPDRGGQQTTVMEGDR